MPVIPPAASLLSISDIIDTNYTTISILEDMQQVAEWLQDTDCFAVMDEELKIVAIITLKDVQRNPLHQVIDADISKPRVTMQQSILDVYALMETAQTDFLPVYLQDVFIGIISLKLIAKKIITYLHHIENTHSLTKS